MPIETRLAGLLSQEVHFEEQIYSILGSHGGKCIPTPPVSKYTSQYILEEHIISIRCTETPKSSGQLVDVRIRVEGNDSVQVKNKIRDTLLESMRKYQLKF